MGWTKVVISIGGGIESKISFAALLTALYQGMEMFAFRICRSPAFLCYYNASDNFAGFFSWISKYLFNKLIDNLVKIESANKVYDKCNYYSK